MLLERGAASVFAVDVGRDQLHAKLRGGPQGGGAGGDRRAGASMPRSWEGRFGAIVADVSFISLTKALRRR